MGGSRPVPPMLGQGRAKCQARASFGPHKCLVGAQMQVDDDFYLETRLWKLSPGRTGIAKLL